MLQRIASVAEANPSSSSMYLILLVLVTTLGPFQFGFHLSELNALRSSLVCPNITSTSSSYDCISLTTPQWAIIQSIYTIGGLCGALLIAADFVMRHGEIAAMKAIALVFMLGSTMEALAVNSLLIMFGRFVSGIGAGAATVVCPIYLAKVAPESKRGLFGTFTQIMIMLGIFTGIFIGSLLSVGGHWRPSLSIGAFFGLIMFIGLTLVQGKAKLVTKANDTPPVVDAERQPLLTANGRPIRPKLSSKLSTAYPASFVRSISQLKISKTDQVPDPDTSKLFEVITNPRYRKATIAVVASMMAQQLTGINSVTIYSVSILSGVIPGNAGTVSTLVAGAMVITTVAFSPLPAKLGNKWSLLVSIAGMGIGSALLGVGLNKNIQALLIPSLLLFASSFGAGLGPVPFMLASDLVTPEAVGAVSSWALMANFLSTFIIAQFFPIIDSALGRGQVFWIFSVVALVFGLFLAWILPSGKEVSEDI